MSGSTFRLPVGIPRWVSPEGKPISRDDFFEWLWARFQVRGLLGVHEGTLLSAEAAEQGLETDSWTLDAGEAPRERDWIGHQSMARAELYFASLKQARSAAEQLQQIAGLELGQIQEQPNEDWDAQWKASFLSSSGVEIPPLWRVVPPWFGEKGEAVPAGEVMLKINPGAGFGTGTHETTQLCLGAIADLGRRWSGKRVLDFGSGSGILAIGAALLGGQVDAVEIDPLAIDNARENAKLNSVEPLITYSQELAPVGPAPAYELVIANILRPVLIEFSSALVARLKPRGSLILSGLIESDVAEVTRRYSELLGFAPERRALNEWRALIWRRDGK